MTAFLAAATGTQSREAPSQVDDGAETVRNGL
jgi:hypothetical protein